MLAFFARTPMSAIAIPSELSVQKDLSGGVKITLHKFSTVLSPRDAIALGTAILKAAGCNVNTNEGIPVHLGSLTRSML